MQTFNNLSFVSIIIKVWKRNKNDRICENYTLLSHYLLIVTCVFTHTNAGCDIQVLAHSFSFCKIFTAYSYFILSQSQTRRSVSNCWSIGSVFGLNMPHWCLKRKWPVAGRASCFTTERHVWSNRFFFFFFKKRTNVAKRKHKNHSLSLFHAKVYSELQVPKSNLKKRRLLVDRFCVGLNMPHWRLKTKWQEERVVSQMYDQFFLFKKKKRKMLQKENKNHFLSLFHAKVYSELQVIYNIMYLFFTTAHLSSFFFFFFFF